jgi:hypothetical protein
VKAFEDLLTCDEDTLTLLCSMEPLSPDQLDKCTDTLTNALQEATATTGKKRKPSANANPWWDIELSEAAKRVGEERISQ